MELREKEKYKENRMLLSVLWFKLNDQNSKVETRPSRSKMKCKAICRSCQNDSELNVVPSKLT